MSTTFTSDWLRPREDDAAVVSTPEETLAEAIAALPAAIAIAVQALPVPEVRVEVEAPDPPDVDLSAITSTVEDALARMPQVDTAGLAQSIVSGMAESMEPLAEQGRLLQAATDELVLLRKKINGVARGGGGGGGSGTPLKNTLVTEQFDSIEATYPSSSSEVYTYRMGGLSGNTVAVVTVSYTNSTKEVLESAVRTA